MGRKWKSTARANLGLPNANWAFFRLIMRGERISLHELTALRLDMTGERAQQPMPRSRKHASGSRDARGNIVASRSFKVRKRTLDVVEQEREHPEKPIEADTIEIQVKTKKRRRDNYIPDLLPFLHAPEMIEKAPQTVSNGLGNNDLPSSVRSPLEG